MSFSVQRVLAIAKNTFREAVRDRILYNLVVFVLLLTFVAVFLGELTAGEEARMIANLGLNAILVFGVFIAIFVGVGLVSKEIEKKTVFAIFAKPVSRTEFIVGKFFGLCLTLLVNVVVMGVGLSLALSYVGSYSLAASVWAAVGLIFLELVIITAIAILFSSFSSPALSALLAFLVFVIGHFSASLRDLAEGLGSRSAKIFFDFIYYIFPNLANFSFRSEAAVGLVPTSASVFGAIAYAVVYSAIMLIVAAVIFRSRNFK